MYHRLFGTYAGKCSVGDRLLLIHPPLSRWVGVVEVVASLGARSVPVAGGVVPPSGVIHELSKQVVVHRVARSIVMVGVFRVIGLRSK